MEEKNKDKKGMEEKQRKTVNMLTLAFAIAFMPPIWAVLAPFIGVGTGSVALICAGLFTANGNRRQDTVKISMGFLLGDLWAYIAVWVMETLQWNPNVELYATLFILGGLAVIIGETFSGIIFTPSLAVRLGHRTDHHGSHESKPNRDPADPDWSSDAGWRALRWCWRGCVPENAGAQAGALRRSGQMKRSGQIKRLRTKDRSVSGM